MNERPRILFVDDEQLLHNLFERLFARHGIDVTACGDALRAVEALKRTRFDLVVTDFMMPDMDGLELLAYVREHHPGTPVIMITAHANVQHAVRSMRSGAVDYIPKPFSTAELVERVQRSLEWHRKQAHASAAVPRTRQARQGSLEFVGEHPSIQKLRDFLPRVSRNRAPVFIQGESGTGKEILARLIHQMSDRADKPYVTLNCANLPRELVESHLFGHRKGAFTGAIDDMVGAFERANGGTLLLDEITEIDLPVQAKLLRVLQENEFQKVGSSETERVDVRVIATSNREPSQAIGSGTFREDLYHRLSVFPLSVPPLRARLSDVPVLADHFVLKHCTLYGLPLKTISPALMSRFMKHPWPGNTRQLENLVQRGVLMSADRTVIEPEDVLNEFFQDERALSGEDESARTLDEMERAMILKALEETGQNQQLAAERLGISARTIRNKLRRYKNEGLIQ
jgi:DNA-binding NtrC family response regulator